MKIKILQTVTIDGVQTQPGIRDVAPGYAESLINAGWAVHPTKRDEDEDEDPDDKREPERKPAPKKATKPSAPAA